MCNMKLIVRTLAFASVAVRFDVAYAVSFLNKYLSKPSVKIINAAQRVPHYLIHTKDIGIVVVEQGSHCERHPQCFNRSIRRKL